MAMVVLRLPHRWSSRSRGAGLERSFPILSLVVQEEARRRVRGCRTALDLAGDECLYLLTLGTEEPRGSVSVQALEKSE